MFKKNISVKNLRENTIEVLSIINKEDTVRVVHKDSPDKVVMSLDYFLELVNKANVHDYIVDEKRPEGSPLDKDKLWAEIVELSEECKKLEDEGC